MWIETYDSIINKMLIVICPGWWDFNWFLCIYTLIYFSILAIRRYIQKKYELYTEKYAMY